MIIDGNAQSAHLILMSCIEFFEVGPISQPVVQVTVNSMKAVCADDYSGALSAACFFNYAAGYTPVVTQAIASTSDPLFAGDTLSIAGLGFGTNSSQISITLGNAPCTINTIEDHLINCTLEAGSAGSAFLQVLHLQRGLANVSSVPAFVIGFRVDSIPLLQDGIEGGALFTVLGSGFSTNAALNNVTIGGADCNVFLASPVSITCVVPPLSDRPQNFSRSNQTYGAQININDGVYIHPINFTYTWSLTPSITFAAPAMISAGRNTDFTVAVQWTELISPTAYYVGNSFLFFYRFQPIIYVCCNI